MNVGARDRRRQEEQEATRAVRRRAAAAAATGLFAERGFRATTMADIAGAAGLSLKALYDGFPSKEALFEAVLEDVNQRFAPLLEAPGPETNPAQWLLDLVERLVQLLAANDSALRLYSRGANGIPAVLRERGVDPFAGFMARLVDLMTDTLCDVRASGGGIDADPAVLARSVLTLVIAETRHRLEIGEPIDSATPDLIAIMAALLGRSPTAPPPS